jgi:citrate lyase subunit beta/citryl-CoA lyase
MIAAPRSYLFVPGDRPERFDKAWASSADAVILGLEDAVAPERKPAAREAVAGWLDASRPVWVRINTPDVPGYDDDLALLARTPGVVRLAFGSIDFQVDLGIEGDDDALLLFRSQLVLASRLASLPPPIDDVTVATGDEALLRRDTERARRLGFGAKLCIHPQQVAAVHGAFSPSSTERDWAARVVAAMQASGGAAVAVGWWTGRCCCARSGWR